MAEPSKRMSWIARAALTLLLSLASFGFVLALFELGLRLTGHAAIYEIYSKPSLFWSHDELLGWSHEPGARGDFVGPRPWPIEFRGRVEINSLGLRGPEIPPPDPSETRVLFVGDSMIASLEVDYDQTFVARLAGVLSERLGRPVRTINAGVRGYGTDQEYLYFRERGWRLEPELVVFWHSSNDAADNTTLHEMRRPFGKPAFSLAPDGGLELVGSPVPRYPMCSEVLLVSGAGAQRVDTAMGRTLCNLQMMLFDHSALFSYLTLALPWDYGFLKRLYYVGNPHAEHLTHSGQADLAADFQDRLTNALVLALADEVRRRGARFLLVGYPTLLPLDEGELARAQIPIVDLSGLGDGLDVRWRHDGHFNPEGHRRVAELLAPQIEAQLREPAPAPAAGG